MTAAHICGLPLRRPGSELASLPPRRLLDLYADAALARDDDPSADRMRETLDPVAPHLVRAAPAANRLGWRRLRALGPPTTY
ncbi:MAG TPA: hypothetical protein VNJ53_12600 [Gaiellaceae bacterium]|nr:hypothetical protein [Gaiellaceae bacterium]